MRFWSNFLYDLIKNVNYIFLKSSSGQTKTLTRMASPFFKKGRKCIYMFVRIFRWRKAVRNHLLNRQSKERRGCRLLRCVNSLLCIWDVLFGWNENILRRARLCGLLLSGCSLCEMQVRAHIQTQRGSCFKARPEENFNQRIRRRILPKPNRAPAQRALAATSLTDPLINGPGREAHRKASRYFGESIHHTLFCATTPPPPQAIEAGERYNTISAQKVWM